MIWGDCLVPGEPHQGLGSAGSLGFVRQLRAGRERVCCTPCPSRLCRSAPRCSEAGKWPNVREILGMCGGEPGNVRESLGMCGPLCSVQGREKGIPAVCECGNSLWGRAGPGLGGLWVMEKGLERSVPRLCCVWWLMRNPRGEGCEHSVQLR